MALKAIQKFCSGEFPYLPLTKTYAKQECRI